MPAGLVPVVFDLDCDWETEFEDVANLFFGP